jgi:hypothetical protein
MLSVLALLFCLATECHGPCKTTDDCAAGCLCHEVVGQCMPPHASPQPKGTAK